MTDVDLSPFNETVINALYLRSEVIAAHPDYYADSERHFSLIVHIFVDEELCGNTVLFLPIDGVPSEDIGFAIQYQVTSTLSGLPLRHPTMLTGKVDIMMVGYTEEHENVEAFGNLIADVLEAHEEEYEFPIFLMTDGIKWYEPFINQTGEIPFGHMTELEEVGFAGGGIPKESITAGFLYPEDGNAAD